ncbi:MAG: chromosome segregation protein SMC, partial [Nitrospirae bacterium]
TVLYEGQMKKRELELKIEGTVSSVKERLGVDITEEPTEGLEAGPEDEVEIERMRQQLQSMEPVNLGALEEFKEVEERFQFLTEQHQDITRSIEELEDAIHRIDRTTRTRLKEAFEALNIKFQEVFQRLFDGGTAELRLTSEDILEAGIEIVAQPPGKKLQNINLLSGGEKAMTALALMFGGFLIKPTPICILDEADAPLDENNTYRFTEMLRELSRDIQFIVITHNRQTMEVADYLYGVTMEEPGVTKILSYRLAEAK